MSLEFTNKDGGALRATAPFMRHEFRRFMLTHREEKLANLILCLSWEEGLTHVRILKLDSFRRMCGLDVPNVIKALQTLQMKRVIQVKEAESGRIYSINPDSDTWQAAPMQTRASVLDELNMLREINGLPRQKEAAVNFNIQQIIIFLRRNPVGLTAISSTEAETGEASRRLDEVLEGQR